MKFKPYQLLLILWCTTCWSCQQPLQVDTIIHNSIIYTLDGEETIGEAIAISDGIIIEVGAENQILNKYIATEKIDAQQGVMYPGFNDAHSHFLGYGLTRKNVDLVGTESWEDVLSRVTQHIENDTSSWVLGRGWDQNDWKNKEYPNNSDLDSLFPNKKVVLKRVDGHALVASSNVIGKAKIDETTVVSGGKILISSGTGVTGVLIDEAMNLVTDIIPEPSESDKEQVLKMAESDCVSTGLTTVTDAGLEVNEINLINSMHASGDLKIRVYAMYSASPEILNRLSDLRIKTDRLSAHAIKVYADGALGSRGARLIKPYSDDSTTNGLVITSEDSVRQWAKACFKDSFQLCVHCIGSAANRSTLNAMSSILGGTNDRRWRIEHAQVVHPEDRQIFGEYNILPSMQPTHATSDMYWAKDRLGENRIGWAYSLQSLMNENGMIPLGTDFPVESINPLHTFYAAIVRKDHKGTPENGFLFEESLSRIEALRGITIWPAIAAIEDEQKGTLEPGKVADLVILDQDILTCEEGNILSTEVLQTWVNGERLYIK